jgi:hypothetical protein
VVLVRFPAAPLGVVLTLLVYSSRLGLPVGVVQVVARLVRPAALAWRLVAA